MKIHFICLGNTFRSRLAEAYLKSKNIPGLIITSSGIEADKNLNGAVALCTINVLKKYKLLQFLSKHWMKTNKRDIEKQDIVIFMENIHYKFCQENLHCNISNYEIWNIPDVPKKLANKKSKPIKEIGVFAEKDFLKIKKKVDLLLSRKILINKNIPIMLSYSGSHGVR